MMETSGRIETQPVLGTSTQPAPQEASDSCLSRSFSAVVDCLCWLWEQVKQFLAMITCNWCFGPAELVPTPPATAPAQRLNAPYFAALLEECYGDDRDSVRDKLTPAVHQLFQIIAPFDVTQVSWGEADSHKHVLLRSSRPSDLATALRNMPSLQNTVTYSGQEVVIQMYHRGNTNWWDSFQPQPQQQTRPSTVTSSTTSPGMMEFFRLAIIAKVERHHNSEEHEKVRTAVDQLFKLIAPYDITMVTYKEAQGYAYIVINSRKVDELETALLAIPSLASATRTKDNVPSEIVDSYSQIALFMYNAQTHWYDSLIEQPQQ